MQCKFILYMQGLWYVQSATDLIFRYSYFFVAVYLNQYAILKDKVNGAIPYGVGYLQDLMKLLIGNRFFGAIPLFTRHNNPSIPNSQQERNKVAAARPVPLSMPQDTLRLFSKIGVRDIQL